MALRHCNFAIALMLAAGLALLTPVNVHAADPVPIIIVLNGDGFAPAEVKAAAGQTFVMKFVNQSPAAAEIEAKDFKVEKVVPAGGEIIVNVKPQAAGRYLFTNEYKEDTVRGFVVVD